MKLTNPVVNPQPWNTPKNNNIEASEDLTSPDQSSNHNSNTNVTQSDQRQLVLLVKDTVLSKIEVRNFHSLGTIVILSSQVGNQISWPSKQLMNECMVERVNWRVFCQFSKLDHVGLSLLSKVSLNPTFSSVWNESSVFVHIAGSFVMLRVGKSPGVEWHK